jgi:dihydrolipoamide dehydrogenase
MARSFHRFDLIIIGGGRAGMNALLEARRYTDNVLLLNDGPLEAAYAPSVYASAQSFLKASRQRNSVEAKPTMNGGGSYYENGAGLHLHGDVTQILRQLAQARNDALFQCGRRFEKEAPYVVKARGYFEGATKIRADGNLYHARAVIIASGYHSYIPDYLSGYRNRLITVETLFDQNNLPHRMGVLGVGSVGMEMAQALSNLGIQVTVFAENARIGGLHDEMIHHKAYEHFRHSFPIHLGQRPTLRETSSGLKLKTAENESAVVDALFVALGYRPNLQGLGLHRIGVICDDQGLPIIDPVTLKINDHPIYLAVDPREDYFVSRDNGMDGIHSVRAALGVEMPTREAALHDISLVMTDPVLARIGNTQAYIKSADHVAGEVAWPGNSAGRENNYLRYYVQRDRHILCGAEMIASDGEHLTHFIAMAVQQKLSLEDLLRLPVNGLHGETEFRNALQETLRALGKIKGQPSQAALS